jgi:hypothetical protein
MKALNNKSTQLDALREDHLLRWTKRMVLRGRGRSFDEHGVCGQQKVVCAGLRTSTSCLSRTLSDYSLAQRSPARDTGLTADEQVGAPWREWGQ